MARRGFIVNGSVLDKDGARAGLWGYAAMYNGVASGRFTLDKAGVGGIALDNNVDNLDFSARGVVKSSGSCLWEGKAAQMALTLHDDADTLDVEVTVSGVSVFSTGGAKAVTGYVTVFS